MTLRFTGDRVTPLWKTYYVVCVQAYHFLTDTIKVEYILEVRNFTRVTESIIPKALT